MRSRTMARRVDRLEQYRAFAHLFDVGHIPGDGIDSLFCYNYRRLRGQGVAPTTSKPLSRPTHFLTHLHRASTHKNTALLPTKLGNRTGRAGTLRHRYRRPAWNPSQTTALSPTIVPPLHPDGDRTSTQPVTVRSTTFSARLTVTSPRFSGRNSALRLPNRADKYDHKTDLKNIINDGAFCLLGFGGTP